LNGRNFALENYLKNRVERRNFALENSNKSDWVTLVPRTIVENVMKLGFVLE
jgi:hypothetical protein